MSASLRTLGLAALSMVAACGDGLLAPSDANVPDDGDAQLVRIRLIDGAGGLPVYFQHEDSTVALATMTDGAGRASAFMSRPGFVTIVGSSMQIITYADVQPGDEIVVGDLAPVPARTIPINVRVPSIPAMGYQVLSSCGATDLLTVPTTIVMRVERCADTMDVLLVSFDLDEDRNPIPGPRFFQHLRDVPVIELSTIVFGDTYEREEPGEVIVEGLDDGTQHVSVMQTIMLGRRVAANAVGGMPVDGGIARVDVSSLPRTPDLVIQTVVDPWSPESFSVPRAIVWGPGTTELTVDLAAGPRAYTERPRFVPEANAIAWAEQPSGEIANIAVARMQWFTILASSSWTLVSPRGEDTSLRFPVLPDPALSPIAPFVDRLDSIAYADGYRAFRDLALVDFGQALPLRIPAGRIAYRGLRP